MKKLKINFLKAILVKIKNYKLLTNKINIYNHIMRISIIRIKLR